MVADKVISTFRENGVCGDDEVTLGEPGCVKGVENFDQAKVLELEPNGQAESSLDNFCEVVVSFRCKFCSFVANDRVAVKNHVKEEHSSINRDTRECSKSEDSPSQIGKVEAVESQCEEQKSKIVEKDEVFFCSDCSIIFSSAELCCNHMIEVHKLQSFGTDLIRENPLSSQKPPAVELKRKRIRCSKQPPDNLLPGKKSKQSPNVEHMCKLCKTKFNSTNALQIHEKCHIAVIEASNQAKKSKAYKGYVKGYTCCFCDMDKSGKFLTWGKCAFHLWKEHEVDCDLYTCSICKYKTPTLAKLKDHELLHSSEAKFTCSICRKSFKQFKQLKTHEKYHKTNQTKLAPMDESRWYTPKECPVCNRILSDSKCLKKHISAVHNKMKPYVCNICGHTSARKAELQLHVRQHTGEKPYKCPACPFSTGDHNSLRKHKWRHTDNKPYECPHCDYSAIQSHAFKKHVLAVHPGHEIVFVCPSCPLVSVNEKAFEDHRKDHEEGRIHSNDHDAQHSSEQTNSALPNACVDESTQASTESAESNEGKSRSKFWLRDDDSMEVPDTGGITIPASESEKEQSAHPREALFSSEISNTITQETPASVPYTLNHSSFSISNESVQPLHPSTPDQKIHRTELLELQEEKMDKLKNGHSVERKEKVNGDQEGRKSFLELASTPSEFEPIDETRAISIVTELLSDGDCNTLNQFFLDPLLNDSIDLPDILCSEHSNDGTLEKLLNMNVTGFS